MTTKSSKKKAETPAVTKLIIGIDPGLSGAVAMLDEDYKFVDLFDMPVEEKKSGKRQVDVRALISKLELSRLDFLSEGGSTFTLVEQVSAMPGQGVSGMFSLGDSFGCARCAAAQVGSVNYAHPATWKRAMKMTPNKAYSLTLARRFYPDQAEKFLARKKDEGRAEALLLARYAVENFDKYF